MYLRKPRELRPGLRIWSEKHRVTVTVDTIDLSRGRFADIDGHTDPDAAGRVSTYTMTVPVTASIEVFGSLVARDRLFPGPRVTAGAAA